jgi:hypothetical protein
MRDTIDMAREVDPVTKLLLDKKLPQGMDHDVFMWFLERFEALVRADEREETDRLRALCDELLSELYVYRASKYLKDTTEAIRARGNT